MADENGGGAGDAGAGGGAGAETLGGDPGAQAGGGASSGGGDMFAGLSEQDRRYAEQKGWPKVGVAGMVEQYRNLETKTGDPDRLVRLPGEDAKPEDVDALWQKLGKPAEPTGEKGYQFQPAEGVDVDPKMDGWFRETAHKHNLTEGQAAGLFEEWNALQAEQHAEFIAAGDKALAQLKAEKGANWPAYEAAAKQAVQMFVPKDKDGTPDGAILDAMEKMLQTGPLLRIWGDIGARISNFGGADMGGGGADVYTPNGAQAEIRKMRADAADPKNPLADKKHPQHKEYSEKFERLHKVAYPEGQGGGSPFMNT